MFSSPYTTAHISQCPRPKEHDPVAHDAPETALKIEIVGFGFSNCAERALRKSIYIASETGSRGDALTTRRELDSL